MPAGHAALATAYLVVALADEYHGETVTGYAVLERAGFLGPSTNPSPPAPLPQGERGEAVGATLVVAPTAVADRAEAVRQAVALSERL